MMKKWSVSVSGHRTSVSLELEFWDALTKIAEQEGRSIAGLINQIDRDRLADGRPSHNLSSAIRIHILRHLQNENRGEHATRLKS